MRVGYVVGEVRTDAFTFVTSSEIAPPRLEYVMLRGVTERRGDELRDVDVLAQVSSLRVASRLLDTGMSYSEVESILRRLGSSPPMIMGEAKVLGYLDDGVVRMPRAAAMPGAEVYHAPDNLLRQFFSREIDMGISIGTLLNRPQVEVLLDPNGLRRHLAVIAQTGAGKSYAVGVLLEQLLQLGGTVIVLDPNSDYVLMRHATRGGRTPFSSNVQVYRLPTQQRGRIPDDEIGETRRFTVQFSRLEPDEICTLTGISDKASRIQKAIRDVHDRLHSQPGGFYDYTPQQFYGELKAIADFGQVPYGPSSAAGHHPGIGDAERFGDHLRRTASEKAEVDLTSGDAQDESMTWFDSRDEEQVEPAESGERGSNEPPSLDTILGAVSSLKYIERLTKLDIWGFEDVPLHDLLQPMTLSTIDLAGIDLDVADFVVSKVLREVWREATLRGLARPAFIVLEEAHNFVPAGGHAGLQSPTWIKRLAAEGRKFGIFLILITQRPYRIHQDTLSQCGSQIIMRLTNPEDQNAVRKASESISESLMLDLPGLNVGEAVIAGPLVRVPAMVRIGQRASREGGADVDVTRALAVARGEAETGRYLTEQAAKPARPRAPYREEV
jgi:hypothetical protein